MFGINLFKKKFEQIDNLVDNRNSALWNEIDNKYKISFKYSINEEYTVYQQSNKVVFYINKNNICIDSFTHELLHVYLSLNGLHINGGFKNRIMLDSFYCQLFSHNLLEHIGNCLEHVKFLPIYLELGFDREKFILDFDVFKCTDTEIKELESFYRIHNKINTNAVDPFVGRLISIIADPNENFDYSQYLLQLKNIDHKLFDAINNLFDNWKKIKIENRTVLDDDYSDVLNVFFDELNIWKVTSSFL